MASEKSPCDAEKEFLPFGHANIAAALAARSAMPLRAVDAIAYHHKQMLMTTSTVVAPNQNPLFLGIILSVCDRVAECVASLISLANRRRRHATNFAESPEIVWLKNYGKQLDFLEARWPPTVSLVKSEEIYTRSFFTEEATEVGARARPLGFGRHLG